MVVIVGVLVAIVVVAALAAAVVLAASAAGSEGRVAADAEPVRPGARRRAAAVPLPGGAAYGPEERELLLDLARRALTLAVTEGRTLPLPADLPRPLREPRGVFVTLEIAGHLRGCIGHIFPKEPLALAVIHNARHAALEDPRFSPVVPAELDQISLEVSVLTLPAPLAFTDPDDLVRQLRPRIDGVVLEIAGHRSTFLPQVWEDLADPSEFLDHLAAKGGSARDAWRGRDVTVLTYRAEAFAEPALGHG